MSDAKCYASVPAINAVSRLTINNCYELSGLRIEGCNQLINTKICPVNNCEINIKKIQGVNRVG